MTLTEAQRHRMEERLLEERARVTRALDRNLGQRADATVQERTGELSAIPSHPADIGTETMREEVAASNASRMSRQLAEIDAALERLYRDPEHFGICQDTGAPIPLERLDIIPWARTCDQANG